MIEVELSVKDLRGAMQARRDDVAQQTLFNPRSKMLRRVDAGEKLAQGGSSPPALSQSVQNLTESTRSLQNFAHIASDDLEDPLRLVLRYS